ncbi:alginate lyase family protein [Pontiella sulfatireligans]|nr:alginate lyase family protein [Pontiella sulfatireligans]
MMIFLLAMLLVSSATADDVQRHVKHFNMHWAEQPSSAEFGIAHVLPLLDLDFQGLGKVKSAAEAEDFVSAEQELLAYFRQTRIPKPIERLTEKDALHAADAMEHRFRGNRDAHPPIFRSADIDWIGRAFVDGEEIHDAEWYYQFQRLTWWPALAHAYAVTGDENYFFEWRYEMVDWVEDNLPITKQTPKFIRRGMETYNRCARLTEVFPYMLQSSNFDAQTLGFFLMSFHEQAEHIRTVYSAKGNHLLGELSVVFMNGINFPEFKASKHWKNDAVERLPAMMDEEVYPDGMNRELVFSYHKMYVGLFAQAYEMFSKHGYADRLPVDFYPRILKMAEIYAYQSFPDFTDCQFGDAWKPRFPGDLYRKNLKAFKDDIPYFDYMVSGGAEGEPPAKRNVAYSESGFYFMRSEWSSNAVFMVMKNAAGGQWHSQIDNGTFELYAHGRNFMNDSGSYMYGSSDVEDQRWRDWFRSTKVHQTLTLNNENIALEPELIMWSESENLVALVIENQSYPELRHRRTVLFIDNKYFLILDEAMGAATGTLRTHYQLVCCNYAVSGLTVQTRFDEGANLLVKSFPQGKALTVEKEEGWISFKPQVKETRPAWSYRMKKTAAEDRAIFLTALVPYPAGAAPKVEASVVEDGFLLDVDGREYRVELDVAKKKMNLKVTEL